MVHKNKFNVSQEDYVLKDYLKVLLMKTIEYFH